MKTNPTFIFLISLILYSCASIKKEVKVKKTFDFENCKYYAWNPGLQMRGSQDSLSVKEIVHQLYLHGLKNNSDTPNVYVDFSIQYQTKLDSEIVVCEANYLTKNSFTHSRIFRKYHYTNNWEWELSNYQYKRYFHVYDRTITFYLIDPKSMNIIWSKDGESLMEQGDDEETFLKEDIENIFIRFPIKRRENHFAIH